VGATQLRQFGAQIYVANLVGLGMAREMGAMMTGIIMAGRTGAAFAARLGTMTVNQEIDALTTMGLDANGFLWCRGYWPGADGPAALHLCLLVGISGRGRRRGGYIEF